MGKAAQKSAKYIIEAKMHATAMVEKPDIVGAIFGQTEGLLDEEMDLRELQDRGKVGRIEVDVQKDNGSAKADIRIPSSLDAANTSILAASLETIERVGPANAQIEVEEVKDERESKRDYIEKRAKQILADINDGRPDRNAMISELREEVRSNEVTTFKGFRAGPAAEMSDSIVLVEGKADLLNLLRNGIKNAVAIGGTDVPDKVSEVAENKDVTAFVDGDRGGEIILNDLKQKIDLEEFAKAPEGKEVEELEKKHINEALRDSEPSKRVDADAEKEGIPDNLRKLFENELKDLVATRAAKVLNKDHDIVNRKPVGDLENESEEAFALVFDGELTRDMVEKWEKDVDYIVGMRKSGYATSSDVELISRDDLGF
jgi:DNA primase